MRWYTPGKIPVLKVRNRVAEWGCLSLIRSIVFFSGFMAVSRRSLPRNAFDHDLRPSSLLTFDYHDCLRNRIHRPRTFRTGLLRRPHRLPLPRRCPAGPSSEPAEQIQTRPWKSSMIETRDLTKKYGDLFALDRLTLKLDKGDVFGFIGPNGAGKTTTMRILATLLNPSWGEASVCGYSIYTGSKDIRRVDRLHARLLRRVRRHEGDRVPRILRGRVPHQGAGTAEEVRPGARPRGPGLQA